MKKLIILSSALLVAFVAFIGLTIVRGAWSEPTVAPPGGNVGAPINVSSLDQSKTGKISVKDVFSDDAHTWLKDVVRVNLLNAAGNSVTLATPGLPASGSLPVETGWLSASISGAVAPPGAQVKALIVRFACSQVVAVTSTSNTGIPASSLGGISYYDNAGIACWARNNQTQVSEVTVPVVNNGGLYTFYYKLHQIDGQDTFSFNAYVTGAYYEY